MTDAEPQPDESTPNVARIYDHLLGGAHNFRVDRETADRLVAANPSVVPTAWANRAFLRHAVEHALSLGVDQFLDLGSGIPTVGNVHEVAHRHDPDARVAYVDIEPVAVAHSRSILAGASNATITHADLRDPATVLAAPGVAGLLDLDRPVAVLALAVLHFVGDEDDPAGILAGYRRALAPGSLLVITHGSSDVDGHGGTAEQGEVARLYRTTSTPAHDRSRAGIRTLIETAGFTVDADGLVEARRWAPARHRDEPLGLYAVISDPLPSA